MVMKIAVSEFKARCTRILRDLGTTREPVEITSRGVVIAVVSPAEPEGGLDPETFLGSLRGTASYVGDIVSPVAEDEWEALR